MKTIHTIGAIALLTSAACNAAFTVDYNFTAADPNTGNAAVSGTDSTAVTANPVVVSNWILSDFGAGTARINGNQMNSTEAFALSSSNYFTFSLSAANAMTPVSVDTFGIKWGGTRGPAQSDFNANLRIRYSLDNFATTGTLLTLDTNTLLVDSASKFITANVDVSGIAFDSVDSVSFRVYGFSPEAAGGGLNFDQRIRVENISLTGSAVPEPSSSLLLIGGLGAMAMRRRRSAC